MIEVQAHHIPPTPLIPNSPRPLLHYKQVLPRNPHAAHSSISNSNSNSDHCDPVQCYDLFHGHGWRVSWIFRYAQTQPSHFHSSAHECMAVLSGTATIRFGAADPPSPSSSNPSSHEEEEEEEEEEGINSSGLEIQAQAGDVFLIPSGVSHKTFNARPENTFRLLTPGKAQGIDADDPRAALADIRLDGFTMMGAYSGGEWDFVLRGGDYEKVWAVPKPEMDPVFGRDEEGRGLRRRWVGSDEQAQIKIVEL